MTTCTQSKTADFSCIPAISFAKFVNILLIVTASWSLLGQGRWRRWARQLEIGRFLEGAWSTTARSLKLALPRHVDILLTVMWLQHDRKENFKVPSHFPIQCPPLAIITAVHPLIHPAHRIVLGPISVSRAIHHTVYADTQGSRTRPRSRTWNSRGRYVTTCVDIYTANCSIDGSHGTGPLARYLCAGKLIPRLINPWSNLDLVCIRAHDWIRLMAYLLRWTMMMMPRSSGDGWVSYICFIHAHISTYYGSRHVQANIERHDRAYKCQGRNPT